MNPWFHGGKSLKYALMGHIPPGGRTYGYTYIKGKVGAHYEINEDEATVVRRIFTLYTQDGLSQEAIAATLTAEGIPTPKGPRRLAACTWCQSSIKFVLRNETYVGHKYNGKRKNTYAETYEGRKVRYKHCPRDTWIPVAVPAIIDQATWDKAQALRVTNKKGSPAQPEVHVSTGGWTAPVWRLRLCHVACHESGAPGPLSVRQQQSSLRPPPRRQECAG